MKKFIIQGTDAFGKVDRIEVTEEIPQEVIDFLEQSERDWQNAQRKERYHTPYHLDALLFEGEDYAAPDTPETIYLGYEETTDDEQMEEYLASLTDVQRRRLRMRLEGMTPAEIARVEGKDESSVRESIESAGKRLHKKFPKFF